MSAFCRGMSWQSANRDGFGINELVIRSASVMRTLSAPANTRKLLLTHISIAIGRVIFGFGWRSAPFFSSPYAVFLGPFSASRLAASRTGPSSTDLRKFEGETGSVGVTQERAGVPAHSGPCAPVNWARHPWQRVANKQPTYTD